MAAINATYGTSQKRTRLRLIWNQRRLGEVVIVEFCLAPIERVEVWHDGTLSRHEREHPFFVLPFCAFRGEPCRLLGRSGAANYVPQAIGGWHNPPNKPVQQFILVAHW
jgi:hypothetical protein